MRGLLLMCVVLGVGCPQKAAPKQTPEAVFWTWFAGAEARLAKEARAKDPRGAMMEISGHLEAVNPDTVAEIAVEPDPMHPHTLVITPNGDTKLFPLVKQIVAAAPALVQWKVVAFRQRRDPGQNIELEGFTAKQADFFFRQTGSARGKVDVEVQVRGMNDANQKAAQQAAFLMLDHLLGEYDVETKIAAISVVPLAEKIADDVKPLATLPAVVDAL